MSNIIYYKDEALSYIFNYKIIPIEENNKDASFIIRTIELYRLAKLIDKIQIFSELTGFHFDNLIPTTEEMNLLIKKGANVVSSYAKLYESEQIELKNRVEYLTNIQEGRAHKPTSYPTARAWATDAHDSVEVQEYKVKNENNKLNKINGIYGLLKPVIEWVALEKKTKLNKKLLDSLPNQRIYLNTLSSEMNWGHEMACNFIIDKTNFLEKYIDEVIESCTPSKNAYILNRTPAYQLDYYKYYYSNNEPHLKQILTSKEYVDFMVNIQSEIQRKLNYM